ncbi:hypothetical protein [uncultured Parabacteroides sp.]|jgi:hypothetical protein|uniref:hypothetical protein n=1 Tax=uncultured Parabacteroides sp. TaxID=512312 RepID=UPI0025D7423F|nr:hypothetical protein [uncultured Parabacteroides sp.]
MNDLSEKAILILLLIGTIIAYGLAGAEEFDQETVDVIGSMPDEVYQEIVNDLGPSCTNQDVVAEYEDNRMYYDSIIAVR